MDDAELTECEAAIARALDALTKLSWQVGVNICLPISQGLRQERRVLAEVRRVRAENAELRAALEDARGLLIS